MDLPNEYFRDFPIEFKQINPEDFPEFDVAEKVKLEHENGFIGESFINNINIHESNTVVLNCGVGSGKTTAIIKAVKQFYDNDEYVIFIASPFVSLVQQYFLDVQEKAHIPQNQIYRNEWIGERSDIEYIDKRVHIVTINTLLGNPGEDSIVNSSSKRKYLNEMVDYCEINGKKVVFIFDEIHDSIHNFKEKFIFNLWKWHNVIHKNFVISATYSEASKVVIEYLAELTHNKIRILESERTRIPERLSELHLYYDNAKKYTNDNGNLVDIVEDVLSRGLEIDILCFSKKLCDGIVSNKEEGAGKLLFNKYGEDINNCTSGLDDNTRVNRDVHENRYNKDKCNIGTNFKSGVSIENDNHAFILIFPPISARGDFRNSYGIFSGGINSIVQSLARKRKKGEIHILLPKPTKFNFNSFPFNESQKLVFKRYFEPIEYQKVKASSGNGIRDNKTIDYVPLEHQNELISKFYYDEFKANVQSSISHIQSIKESRLNKTRLEFPEFKLFKLEDGEKYLADNYKFFGSDLSGYLSYGAVTNQFVNCDLVSTNWKPTQSFKIDKMQYGFEKFYKNYFNEDWFYSLKNNVSDLYIYHEIRNEIFNNYNIKLCDAEGNSKFVKPFQDKLFEQQLIAFAQRKLFSNNTGFVNRFKDNGYVIDDEYSRGDYFLSCIATAHSLNDRVDLDEDTRLLVEAYLSLDYFRLKLINNILITEVKKQEIKYIPVSNESFLMDEDILRFISMLTNLINKDILIKNDIFNFKRSFSEGASGMTQLNSFYKYLTNDFFVTKNRKINREGLKGNFKVIIKIKELPNANDVLDFLTKATILLPDDYMQAVNCIE
ncbi:DEAD/DEAH box helicase family protein [uncultured Gelidibacter sp.]|uniref:DEAD/DEAH box helicase family protein n=1 Tax=uncultured Gelidibacter sp. TaxID=259318 RepID=UPI0026147A53|nr:DEAD/DEAH box helicase family protein [uncultured Gelidibacter sp.]